MYISFLSKHLVRLPLSREEYSLQEKEIKGDTKKKERKRDIERESERV